MSRWTRRVGFFFGASALALCVANPTLAQTPDGAPAAGDQREARIEQLEAQVQQLVDEVADLKRSQASQIETIASDEKRLPPASAALVTLSNGRPTFATSDGKFTAQLHGVMQLDAATYAQPSAGPTATDFRRSGPAIGASASNVDAAHARDLKDGVVFRRARIGIDGTAFGDFDYRLLFDFGGPGGGTESSGQLYEAWVQYTGLKPVKFRVGAFSPSLGLDDQASTNGMPFIERAASSDLARGLAGGDTRTAFQISGNGDHWLAAVAATSRTIGVLSTGTATPTAQTYRDPLAFTARVAGTPFHGNDWLIHVGAHGSYLARPANTSGPVNATGASPLGTVSFSVTPELRVDTTRLINTGSIPAQSAYTAGAEVAAQKGPFLVQAEYENIGVSRPDHIASPNFSGYYVSGTWVITGESRKYNTQTGAFDAPPVSHPFSLSGGGWGAWELGVRYSDMNLNFNEGAAGKAVASGSSTIRGGDEQNITVGLNWYPNSLVKFMLDYSHVRVDRLSPGTSANNASIWLLPAGSKYYGAQIGQSYDAVAIRSQFAF